MVRQLYISFVTSSTHLTNAQNYVAFFQEIKLSCEKIVLAVFPIYFLLESLLSQLFHSGILIYYLRSLKILFAKPYLIIATLNFLVKDFY